MFSGIVQKVGTVIAVDSASFGRVLLVDPGRWDRHPAPGESVAVNGCCLTVTDPVAGETAGHGEYLRFDLIRQTLQATTLGDLGAAAAVNLEAAMTPNDLIGGHLVQGHVDGVGLVRHVEEAGERRLTIEPPLPLMEYIIERGSIALDGVSLTVAALGASEFEVALIPTTIQRTILGRLGAGSKVNLETDYLVKAAVTWLQRQEGLGAKGSEFGAGGSG